MRKHTIIIHSPQLPNCPNQKKIFNSGFQILAAQKEEQFLAGIRDLPADAAIVCFCSANEEDMARLERLNVCAGPLPVLTCSRSLNPEFIRKAALRGVDRFLMCDMKTDKISDLILDAIRDTGLEDFLDSCIQGGDTPSPYIRKFINEIIFAFPHRLEIQEFSRRLGIDQGWLCKLCKKTFRRKTSAVLRMVWVHQALRLMQRTNLSNREIAELLYYSEESSMAREFRKELGYSPVEARRRLLNRTPEELLSP